MKKNILLINPWIYDFAAYDFWNKPLGLLYIASLLRMNGYLINIIDCLDPWNPFMRKDITKRYPRRFDTGHGNYYKEIIPKPEQLIFIPRNYHRYGISTEVFHDMLLRLPRPDMIFITSMMTYWYPAVFSTISTVKDVFSDVPVVLGGNYVSLCPQHAKRSGADFIIQGEGEQAISHLFKKVWGDKLSFVPNPEILDSYPFPAYDLIFNLVQLPILTSRGCPFHCTYCSSDFLYPSFRRRSPDNVFCEILHWHRRLGVQHFSLYDDALLVRPYEMALPLLKEIIKQHLLLNFHCPNGLHIREITDEMAKLLFTAGFKTLRFGFESSNTHRQYETGGKVTNEELKNAVHSLKQAGYQERDIGIYILCGLPNQTAEEIKDSIFFVISCGARPILAEYSPIPNTALWEDAVTNSPFNIAEEQLFHNNSIIPCRSPHFSYDMYNLLKIITKY